MFRVHSDSRCASVERQDLSNITEHKEKTVGNEDHRVGGASGARRNLIGSFSGPDL